MHLEGFLAIGMLFLLLSALGGGVLIAVKAKGRKKAGILLGYLCLALWTLYCGMPGLGQAREKARTTSCINNQKQIGTAIVFYQDESGGYYPHAYLTAAIDGTESWAAYLVQRKYLNFKSLLCDVSVNRMVETCRSAWLKNQPGVDWWQYACYALNMQEFGKYPSSPSLKTSRVVSPAKLLTVTESISGTRCPISSIACSAA